ncbi:hypothetical protein U9M48_008166 [Paspalum notatum var. saurae]|uniref:Uncharacterized protein n=1 Tax=Paspalum notatum var. saurae TaxID=547442 RepID=A0AAQ3SP41_PASNO
MFTIQSLSRCVMGNKPNAVLLRRWREEGAVFSSVPVNHAVRSRVCVPVHGHVVTDADWSSIRSRWRSKQTHTLHISFLEEKDSKDRHSKEKEDQSKRKDKDVVSSSSISSVLLGMAKCVSGQPAAPQRPTHPPAGRHHTTGHQPPPSSSTRRRRIQGRRRPEPAGLLLLTQPGLLFRSSADDKDEKISWHLYLSILELQRIGSQNFSTIVASHSRTRSLPGAFSCAAKGIGEGEWGLNEGGNGHNSNDPGAF